MREEEEKRRSKAPAFRMTGTKKRNVKAQTCCNKIRKENEDKEVSARSSTTFVNFRNHQEVHQYWLILGQVDI